MCVNGNVIVNVNVCICVYVYDLVIFDLSGSPICLVVVNSLFHVLMLFFIFYFHFVGLFNYYHSFWCLLLLSCYIFILVDFAF